LVIVKQPTIKIMATILLTGGNGLVGSNLSRLLQDKGYDVAILSRQADKKASFPTYKWNPEKMEIDPKAIEKADYIIHLAGENIGKEKWTPQRKKQIVDSRVKTSELLFTACLQQHKNLKAFISASAIGYYGMVTSNHIFTEIDAPSSDFLGTTCKSWEQAAQNFKEAGIRTVILRTAAVLSEQGGFLSKLLPLTRLGLCSALGSGRQFLPWIHIDDLCNIYLKAIEDDQMTGVYNAVAPDHRTNQEITRAIAQTLNKPYWIPHIPAFFLRMRYGEMAEMLLTGSRVSARKIWRAGYEFKFQNLESALKDLC